MTRYSFFLLAALAGLLVACGGSSPRTTTSQAELDAEDEEDRIVDHEDEEDDEDDEDDEGGVVDAAALRGMMGGLELGELTEVPGTGVSMRAPANAQPMPFGAGFLSLRERVQITVAVVEGGEEVLEAIRTGGDPRAPQPVAQEEHEVAGQAGRIGRDEVRTSQGVLERQWLLVHDGSRGLGIVATYEQDRADGYRGTIRQALSSVEWDREVELDPSAALGIDVGPVEGLEPSRRSTANLVFLVPGEPYPPEPSQVVLTVSPLPMRIPEERAMGICPRLAAQLLPAPDDDVSHEADVEGGELRGCERVASAELPDGSGRVAAYAAVLFHEGTPILVTASVPADQMDTWQPRFNGAARSVHIR